MKKQLISCDQAKQAKKQHSKPCSDCPWSRKALPGWLGAQTEQEWIAIAHSEATVECHTLVGARCAGIAIYRANVVKRCRDPEILALPRDKTLVFASPTEFLEHHGKVKRV